LPKAAQSEYHYPARVVLPAVEGPPQLAMSTSHAIFVYGTLKRGFTNYTRYLGVAETEGKAVFLGEATTTSRFPMTLRPPHLVPATNAPLLLDSEGVGEPVCGEVFEVDDSTLEAMDLLEGIRKGKYHRRNIQVRLQGGDELVIDCGTYFFPPSEDLLTLPRLNTYGTEEHAIYSPSGPVKEDIRELCQGWHRSKPSRL